MVESSFFPTPKLLKSTQHRWKLPVLGHTRNFSSNEDHWDNTTQIREKQKTVAIFSKKTAEKVFAAKLMCDQTAFDEKIFANRRTSDLQ